MKLAPGTKRRRAVWNQAYAQVSVWAAFGVTWATWPLLQATPLSAFFAAVTFSAWIGGLGPGLVATALSVPLGNIFFIKPYGQFSLGLAELLITIPFLIVAVATCLLTEARRKAEAGLTLARDELDERVRERTAELSRANASLEGEIAGRRQAEEERERLLGQIRAERGRFEAVLQQLPVGVTIVEAPTGQLLLDNDEASLILRGQVRADGGLIRFPFVEAVHPDGTSLASEDYPTGRAIRHGEVVRGAALRFRNAEGGLTDLSVNAAPIRDVAGRIVAAVSVFQDVTERLRTEAERSDLLRRIVTSQEEERHRIARELHDQMGQHLTALTLGLAALRESDPDRSEPIERRILSLQDLVKQVGAEAHRIALELRPTALDDLGLHSAVLNYVEEWSERTRIEVDYQGQGIADGRLAPEIESALYRIVQEALTNVARHSRASRVGIVLEQRREQILGIVEDDGVGFDAEAVLAAPAPGRRLGLLGMRERAALVGGSIAIESSPEGGTTVLIRMPADGRGRPA